MEKGEEKVRECGQTEHQEASGVSGGTDEARTRAKQKKHRGTRGGGFECGVVAPTSEMHSTRFNRFNQEEGSLPRLSYAIFSAQSSP